MLKYKIFMRGYAKERQNNNQIMEVLITNVTKYGLLLNNDNAVLPRKTNRRKQKWMTDHILNLMENRKQFKDSDKD